MAKIYNLWNIAARRVAIAEKFMGFDLSQNFFELSDMEISRLESFRKVCGFSGKNYLGRSKSRQFWYYLQKQKQLEAKIEEEYGLPF